MSDFNQLIQQSGKSMTQIAREANLSLSTVSKIASGTRKPSVFTAYTLAKVMGVDAGVVVEAVHNVQ